jgi:hypothetical protein
VYPADFQQISTLEPNLATKFKKFCGEIFITQSTTHNDSKKVSFIKIHPETGDRRYLPFCAKKQAKSNKKSFFFSGWIFINFTRLAALNRRYLWSPWMDFDE